MPLIRQVLDDTGEVIPNGSVPHVVSLCARVQDGPPGLIARGVRQADRPGVDDMAPRHPAVAGHVRVAHQDKISVSPREAQGRERAVAFTESQTRAVVPPGRRMDQQDTSPVRQSQAMLQRQPGQPISMTTCGQAAARSRE